MNAKMVNGLEIFYSLMRQVWRHGSHPDSILKDAIIWGVKSSGTDTLILGRWIWFSKKVHGWSER